MRFSEFYLFEEPKLGAAVDAGNLLGIKQEILDKVESLEMDKEGRRILQRVNDILVKNGTLDTLTAYSQRVEGIAVKDKDVAKAVDQLAKLIAAASQTTSPKDRDFFFKLWEEDRIVLVDKLLQGDKVYKMNELFNYYGKSRALTYVVDSLARDAGYGLGKGELLLAILSRRIKNAGAKGDLIIDDLKIEVKTTDGGAPRFADQEVRVGQGYEQIRDLIFKKYQAQIEQIGGLGKTGLNLRNYIAIGQFPDVDKNGFKNDTEVLLSRIFPDHDNGKIVNSIMSGNLEEAARHFAEQTFNRYMNIKDDDAVLYINLAKGEPIYVLFRTVEDLEKLGLKFKPSTIYILGTSGNRDVYPQTSIIPSS